MALSSLPIELVRQIYEHTQDPQVLVSLACTCRALKETAEALLYGDLSFTRRSPVLGLLKAMKQCPRRRHHVRNLELLYAGKNYDYKRVTPPVDLSVFPNLTSFECESPLICMGSHRYHKLLTMSVWATDLRAYLEAFASASPLSASPQHPPPLANLVSLTLHWTNPWGGELNLSPDSPVFLLPHLRNLRMSYVHISLPSDDSGSDSFTARTNLETLALGCSRVEIDALERLLSRPAALRELTCHGIFVRSYNGLGVVEQLDAQHRALTQLSKSLRYLEMTNIFESIFEARSTLELPVDLSGLRSLTCLRLHQRSRPLQHPPPALKTIRIDLGYSRYDAGYSWSMEEMEDLLARLNVEECLKNRAALREPFRLEMRLHIPSNPEPVLPLTRFIGSLIKILRNLCAPLTRQNPIDQRQSHDGLPDWPPTPTQRPVFSFILRVLSARELLPDGHQRCAGRDHRQWKVLYDSDILCLPYAEDEISYILDTPYMAEVFEEGGKEYYYFDH